MKSIEWQFLIISYLYLGGLSAGLFFVSGLATLLRKKEESAYTRIASYGALLAPWPVIIGCSLLIFDLGHWYRFYKLFLHFRWTSPMSIGSWLLSAFVLVSLLYCYSWLPVASRERMHSRLPCTLRRFLALDRDSSSWQRPLAIIGFPISLGVGIYTGVLLGAVQSRPFWNTSLVAQLFLFSALSTGCAALIFTLSWRTGAPVTEEIRWLYILDTCILTLEFFIVLPYIIHGQLSVQAVQESLKLILGGPLTLAFWLFFFGAGLFLPLAIETWEILPALLSRKAVHYNKTLVATTALLVLFGGFVLRYIFVYAGQMSAFR